MDGHPFEFFTEQHCCFFLADDCIKGRAEACQPHPREKFLVMETPFKKSIRTLTYYKTYCCCCCCCCCSAGQGRALGRAGQGRAGLGGPGQEKKFPSIQMVATASLGETLAIILKVLSLT